MTTVVHTVASLAPESGGPARTVTGLTDSLAEDENFSIILVTQRRAGAVVIESAKVNRAERQIADSKSGLALTAGLPFRRQLNEVIRIGRPGLIHDHGIWHPVNHHAARAARRHGIPLLIQTRGMLEPWALDYHAWKKRSALWLYQRRNLDTAKLFFATADQEVESIRRLGLKQPVAMIPNGVDFPGFSSSIGQETKTAVPDSDRRIAVFMSRIHPKKGLLNLMEAWARTNSGQWLLQLAGPDEGGHLAEVMRCVQELGLESSVEYVGEVEGGAKQALLENAELFILPSFSENFGVVVAEALAYGVPVVTTRGTPWEGLVHHECGWWIEPTVEALTETLREALNKSPDDLKVMGEKGRTYVKAFNWAHIARQTGDVYRWIQGRGSMPACVVLD